MPETGATIEIEGLDELVKKLNDLSKLKTVHAGIKAAGLYVKGKIAIYPPQTIANSPNNPSGQWYQRGWGIRYKGGGGRQVSEQLGKKWTMKYDQAKFEAVVGNNASYAVFVQGPKQGSKGSRQAGHMARIGWKSVDTVAEQESKRVQEYVYQAVRRAIGA
jgi:phage gpG-like protein